MTCRVHHHSRKNVVHHENFTHIRYVPRQEVSPAFSSKLASSNQRKSSASQATGACFSPGKLSCSFLNEHVRLLFLPWLPSESVPWLWTQNLLDSVIVSLHSRARKPVGKFSGAMLAVPGPKLTAITLLEAVAIAGMFSHHFLT